MVFEGDLLLKPQSEFNSESLSSVKVKIENGDNVGYLEINFKTITVIAEDDINKGGDDDNNNDQIDDDETTFVGDATGAKYVIYDGLPHGLGMLEITVDGETKVLKEADGTYDVVYGELEEEPVDAGTYSATITFNEALGYSGTVILENSVKIEKRPLNISFSFSEPIEEGKVPTLDDAEISLGETSLGKGDYLTDCIDVTFKISNEQNADKKYDVYIEHISITNSTSENNGFKPSNYDITIVCKDGVSVKMEDTNGDGVITQDDRVVVGNPNPDFIYGFNTSLTIRNFSLSASFTGSYGNDVYNQQMAVLSDVSTNSENRLRAPVFDAWSPENPDSKYPSSIREICF